MAELEETSDQCRHCGLDSQNSRTKTDRAKSDPFQRRDFLRDESTFWSDDERYELLHIARAFARRSGMRDECQRVLRDRRELVLHKRTEKASKLDHRHHRVARLLETQDALRADAVIGNPRRFPVTLLDAPGVDEKDPLDAHRSCARDHAIHDLGTRQRQNESQWQGRWRIAVELDFELSRRDDLSDPAAAVHDADAHRVAADARDCFESSPGDSCARRRDEIFRKKQDEIHAVYHSDVNIETRKKGDVVIVDFQGRLAIGVGDEVLPALIEQLLSEGNRKILLNLSDMDYIDSNGLGELVQSLKTSKRFGASLRLLKPQDRVRKTLRLTNLLPMFSVYETEADALKGFASEA
ncbi:MAG: hypothetical protein DMF59_16980 [Acidobacteria bacterium]|nr:MAG: hypothetical protein DMF59_16980 [Acidobacteriota bacterium]